MKITKIITPGIVLSSVFLISSNAISGKLQLSYDSFKDKTTITVTGEQNNQNKIMYLLNIFHGKQEGSAKFVMLGFLTDQGCPHPSFIADGKRVQPSSDSESLTGIDTFGTSVNTSKGVEDYLFVYNFYDLAQVRQIANAKSVKYKICDDIYSLSAGDRAELRQFLSRFK